jgi:hypothetical protein
VNKIDEFAMWVEELDSADAVAAVPEAGVTAGAIWGFVVHQEHVLFLAGDVRDHAAGSAALLNVPDDLRVGFPTVEVRIDERPSLGEIELIGRSFVPEGRQKLAREGQRADLGPPAADVENAVHELLARNFAGQVVG